MAWPTPATDGMWEIRSRGWVGVVPLDHDGLLTIHPRVPLANLFGMLEYAYRLKLILPEGLRNAGSMNEFYERLAAIFSRRVLDRARRGFYRAYLPRQEERAFVRGRMDLRRVRPWRVQVPCRHREHTADLEENRLLAWTLQTIGRNALCGPRTLPLVRRAYRAVRNVALPEPFTPGDCLGRIYNRLNEDYRALHAFCRFFLEGSGPDHREGERQSFPFLLDMSRLFEMFTAEWLRAHLPGNIRLSTQERVGLGEGADLYFQIDLVLYDLNTGRALSVLDTKYKPGERPSADDVAQVVAYATERRCAEAWLIYPEPIRKPWSLQVGDVRVRGVAFDLSRDLEGAGREFEELILAAV